MWFHRSVVWMHGTSVSGVSFTLLSHCVDVTAPAPLGTSSPAITQQNGAIHPRRSREPVITDMRASLPVCPSPLRRPHDERGTAGMLRRRPEWEVQSSDKRRITNRLYFGANGYRPPCHHPARAAAWRLLRGACRARPRRRPRCRARGRRQGAPRPDTPAPRRCGAQGRARGRLSMRARSIVRHIPAGAVQASEGADERGRARRRAAGRVDLLLRTRRGARGATRMAVLRPHLALTVTDVERAIPFYRALFGVDPEKVKPGYAKFSVAEPAINFTLNQGERGESLGAFNHAGIQVAETADVLAAKERLVSAGLAAFDEMDTTCCYARQDKIWVRDPDGTPWEVFATHEDTDEEGEGGLAAAEAGTGTGQEPCGCGETGCGCAARGAADACCAA